MNIKTLASRLTQYDEQEAQSIVRLLLADCFCLSLTDICCGAVDKLSQEDSSRLMSLMDRLADGEPVQYVIGKTLFCGREFAVREGCLIPRPETEELCQWVISDRRSSGQRVLDIGTGSGCIGITLALSLTDPHVTAWDISPAALDIARGNADALAADVSYEITDALNIIPDGRTWDVVVSNPPYICNKESVDMEHNVLDHEPHLALFVPDDDPLLFYRKIAEYASTALTADGALYFEINPLYVTELTELLRSFGFSEVEVRADIYGRERMVKASSCFRKQ